MTPEVNGKKLRYKMTVPGVIDKSPNVLKFDTVIVRNKMNEEFEMEVLEVLGETVKIFFLLQGDQMNWTKIFQSA